MRHRVRIVTAVAAAATALAALPAGAAAGTLERIDLPSRGNVDASQVHFNGAGHPGRLVANVLLPDGFDRSRRYPVLYLLHGAGENYASWVTKTKADVVAKDLQAIVVMPDAATGFYVNQWNGGRRGAPGWERYFLDEVIPEVEARYPIRPGRRWHAIGGFSMGGYGTAYLASQRPDYFGAAAPMSGFLAIRRPELALLFDVATGQSYDRLYGPMDGFYAAGHDPVALVGNLRHTRLFVITGNGVPDPSKPPSSSAQSTVTDSAGEAELKLHADDFTAAARAVGAAVTYTVLLGVHNHPYWTEHLRRFLAWDPFAPVAEHPSSWRYTTVADRGRAWDVTYRFAAPPESVETLSNDDGRFAATGSGTLELCAADGRGVRAALPFDGLVLRRAVALRVLPAGRRLRVELRSDEPVTVALRTRVARGGRAASASTAPVALAAGERRVVTVRLGPRGRALLRRTGVPGAVRVVARHGACAGGRWTSATARLR